MDIQQQRLERRMWRRNAKKMQRKRRRRLAAQKRHDSQQKLPSPPYNTNLIEDNTAYLDELECIKRNNEIEHNKWIESDLEIDRIWRIKQRKLEEQAKRVENERQRIQEEFKAEQKRIADAELEKKRVAEEERQMHIDLKNRIQSYINGFGDIPPEILVTAETNPGKELCPYFVKTSSCRFGNKCVRNHTRYSIGKVLKISSFFTNIHLEQTKGTEYGDDMTLECDESDLYNNFKVFFSDVVPEFETFGIIRNFVVCKNHEPHLRGHVFVEYASERNALRAQQVMNCRFYAGRMLNVEFCKISWNVAVCGSSLKNSCTKGQSCNFLHVFKNPHGQYSVLNTLKIESERRNSHRFDSMHKEEIDNWSFKGEISRRNWRWSESPLKEIIHENVKRSEKVKHRHHHSRSRSRSKRTKRTKRSRSRDSGRTQKLTNDR